MLGSGIIWANALATGAALPEPNTRVVSLLFFRSGEKLPQSVADGFVHPTDAIKVSAKKMIFVNDISMSSGWTTPLGYHSVSSE